MTRTIRKSSETLKSKMEFIRSRIDWLREIVDRAEKHPHSWYTTELEVCLDCGDYYFRCGACEDEGVYFEDFWGEGGWFDRHNGHRTLREDFDSAEITYFTSGAEWALRTINSSSEED